MSALTPNDLLRAWVCRYRTKHGLPDPQQITSPATSWETFNYFTAIADPAARAKLIQEIQACDIDLKPTSDASTGPGDSPTKLV